MSMEELLELVAPAEKRRVDPLGEAQEVGRDPLVRAREQRAGSTEAGRHLIDDEVHRVAPAQLRRRRQKSARMDEHAGCALDERLHHERSELTGVSNQLLL